MYTTTLIHILVTVSYTHLDVYKRQLQTWPDWFKIRHNIIILWKQSGDLRFHLFYNVHEWKCYILHLKSCLIVSNTIVS